ncbi:hypothetical protein KW796_00725 [Candidatus Parcubacteria bacterium]|nr:hypothetical protein [Candidatus Parcubacteria bacterium]
MRTLRFIDAATAERRVKKMHPTAFLYYEGGGHYSIKEKEHHTDPCPHCRQEWKREGTNLVFALGRGPSEIFAWLDAYKRMRERGKDFGLELGWRTSRGPVLERHYAQA